MGTSLLGALDVAIGIALVMILLSTVLTAVTQLVLAAWYARARYLRAGLAELIAQVDRADLKDSADEIAELVLRHPAVGRDVGRVIGIVSGPVRSAWHRLRQRGFLPARNPATVIELEELLRILLEIASEEWDPASDGASKAAAPDRQKLDGIRTALKKSLQKAGIADPAATLAAVRTKRIELQALHPDESARELLTKAMFEKAHSEFLARITGWFDQTMDRTTQRFTTEARAITVVGAFLVAVLLQVDSLAILTRLSADDNYRAALVEQARVLQDAPTRPNGDAQPSGSPPPAETGQAAPGDVDAALANVRQAMARFSEPPLQGIVNPVWECARFEDRLKQGGGPGLLYWRWLTTALVLPLTAPCRPETPGAAAVAAGAAWLPLRPQGLILSWVLLSFGAPFWFEVLKNLLKLRPLLAQKEEKRRTRRAGDEAAP